MANGDTTFTIKAVDKTKAAFKSVGDGLKNVSHKVFSLQGAVAGLAGAAGFGALIHSVSELADSTAKAADRLKISTQALTGLQYASSLAGVETSKFNGYLAHMEKSIGQAAAQGGQMAQVLKLTGVNIQQLNAMNPQQQFLTLADAMNHMSNANQRAYAEQILFSDSTNEMLSVMSTGRGKIEALTKEAERFGLAINRADAAKIEAANDSFTRLGAVVKGVATSISVALSPYVAALANRIADAANKSNGFKDIVLAGVEKMTLAVGYLGNMWRGLEVVWKMLEVGFYEFAHGIYIVFEKTFGKIFEVMGHLPKIGRTFQTMAQTISNAAIDTAVKADKLAGQLYTLANKPMPSDSIRKFFADVRAEADKSAKHVAAVTQQNNAHSAAPATPIQDQQLAARLQQLMDSTKSEHQVLDEKYQDQQFLLDDALNNNLISYQTYNDQMQALELQHQAKMGNIEAQGLLQRRKFEEMTMRQRAAFVISEMVGITQGVAQQNKTMFEINKIAGIANAVVNTYVGVSKTLAAYPYPWNLPLAALHLAAGLAQVNAIRSQSFGAGGAAPSLAGQGGGSSTVNNVPLSSSTSSQAIDTQQSQQQQTPPKQINISISGNPTGQQVRDLIDAINTEVGDGAQLTATQVA